MSNLLKSLLVACALVQMASAVYPMGQPNPQSLATLFFRSRLASQDPTVSMACFADYIVKSNDVSEVYGTGYNQCLVDAKAGREAIESEMSVNRVAIAESSQNVCKRLSTCDGLNTTLEIFNCHAKIGANNTKAVYVISGNASEYANLMQEQYRIIDMRHEQCCKSAERSYVEATAVTYRTLQDCLEGRIQPITTTTSTTTTTTTTTPEPTTTTTSSTTTTTTAAPPTEPSTTTTTAAPPSVPETTPGLPEIMDPTYPPGTEQFAKLLQLLK